MQITGTSNTLRNALVAALTVFLCGNPSAVQSTSSGVNGVVTDPNGAVIGNASQLSDVL
jgi:hypothetical protein